MGREALILTLSRDPWKHTSVINLNNEHLKEQMNDPNGTDLTFQFNLFLTAGFKLEKNKS